MALVVGAWAVLSCASVICVTGRLCPIAGWLIDLLKVAASVGVWLVALSACARVSLVPLILVASAFDELFGHSRTPSVRCALEHSSCRMSAGWLVVLSMIAILPGISVASAR